MANFCRVYVKPSAGYWTSRFEWFDGTPCEVGLPHVGDFHDRAESEAWLKKYPEKYPAGELDFRELDVDRYFPHYVREEEAEKS